MGRTSHNVRENTASAIHTLRATDPDRGDTFTWTTGGNDGYLFEMSDQGALSFRVGTGLREPAGHGFGTTSTSWRWWPQTREG